MVGLEHFWFFCPLYPGTCVFPRVPFSPGHSSGNLLYRTSVYTNLLGEWRDLKRAIYIYPISSLVPGDPYWYVNSIGYLWDIPVSWFFINVTSYSSRSYIPSSTLQLSPFFIDWSDLLYWLSVLFTRLRLRVSYFSIAFFFFLWYGIRSFSIP